MATEDSSLIVTAHPDDETIFFTGLILSRPKTRWSVVCVTDGNADQNGLHRIEDLKAACKRLGVESVSTLGFPDKFEERLDTEALQEQLSSFSAKEVFTHGVLGEYGHPHHQDVCFAAHKCFFGNVPVYSVAHNCFPDFTVNLSQEMWNLKSEIYSQCYFSETRRFIQMLPIQPTEGFTKVSMDEVSAIYHFLAKKQPLNPQALCAYKALEPYLEDMAANTDRPF